MIGAITRLKFSITAVTIAVLMLPTDAFAERSKKPEKLQETVVLKEHVVIKANVIRIGDLFSNAGEKATVPIAYAPAPGQRLVLDVNWLYRAASAYKLNWKPFTHNQHAVVVRDSITFKQDAIKARIREALMNQGINKADEIELGDRLYNIHAPNEFGTKLDVEEIAFDKKSGRFTATLSITSSKPGTIRRVLGGWVRKMTSVPVLARRISTYDVIKQHDIKMVPVRSNRVQEETIVNAKYLIGKSPSRTLTPGAPLRRKDVRPPLLVTKGSLVTMILQGKFMRLTARGRALESGSKDDVIRIRNSKSNKKIEAVVIGPGKVSIDPLGHMAMN